MITHTAPVTTHRHPNHPAVTARAAKRQADRDMTAAEMRLRGMKRSLATFKSTPEQLKTLPAGFYAIQVINEETGELRYYMTQYEENIRYIGNTDYMAHGYERTSYKVFIRTAYEETSWHLVATRLGKGRHTTN